MLVETANNAVVLTERDFASATRTVPRASREVLRFVLGLSLGSVRITLPDGRIFMVDTGKPGPHAEIRVRNWRFARRVMFAGDVGLGDSYGDGDWDSPDVTEVVRLFAINEDLTANFLARSPVARLAFQLRHFLNRNTKTGSQRNISAHYDLGNTFYSEWLDRSMTYSSAIFAPGDNDLSSAQARKYRALADSMGVQPDEHVLEIGCGWGGFAEFLAKERGARVTALTISREQFDFATRRMQQAGLGDRVEIRFQDYRDERGLYDRIGSIEMFEAVGESYWGTYFSTLRDRLKSGGTAGLQIITVADRFFEDYRRNIDFIRRFIFPGGMLPSPAKLAELASSHGLAESSNRSLRHDYAETLRQWRASFDTAWPRLQPMGFDERFRRLWRYYLSYCEGGFDAGSIDVHQIVYRKG
ncbi:MAG: class I SAM-dependent methyltransferase [Rhizobiales bacterium]|nr:class I SAM-dependent methyltransferase [Hyphomicrobiales bacterium]